jgi:hypothetical protein
MTLEIKVFAVHRDGSIEYEAILEPCCELAGCDALPA